MAPFRPQWDDHAWEGWNVGRQYWYVRTAEDWVRGMQIFLCTRATVSLEEELVSNRLLDTIAREWPQLAI